MKVKANNKSKGLDIVKGGAKIEASFIRTGKMNGIDVTNTGTFWSIPIEGGFFVRQKDCLLPSKEI